MVECVFEPRRNHRLTVDPSPSLSAGRRPAHIQTHLLMSPTAGCPILHPPLHPHALGQLAAVRFLQSDVHCGRVAGSNGSGKKFVRWEVMAMAKPPLRRHYCTSAQPLPLPIQRVGTNQPSDDDCCAADVDEHRLHAQLTAGIEGLILAKHIGVINSGSACPIHQRSHSACCISTTILPGDWGTAFSFANIAATNSASKLIQPGAGGSK